MRNIKFRGISYETKDWVYGHYTQGTPECHYITTPEGAVWQVKPETIGEFTGLKGKDGVEIYEGDLILTYNTKKLEPVYFDNGCFMWVGEPLAYNFDDTANPVYLPEKWAEVSGNIHQNAETLTA